MSQPRISEIVSEDYHRMYEENTRLRKANRAMMTALERLLAAVDGANHFVPRIGDGARITEARQALKEAQA